MMIILARYASVDLVILVISSPQGFKVSDIRVISGRLIFFLYYEFKTEVLMDLRQSA